MSDAVGEREDMVRPQPVHHLTSNGELVGKGGGEVVKERGREVRRGGRRRGERR